jgi:hypothetical protein
MTSRTTGAFQLRTRLSKTLTSVAVAATGMVAGATMLSGGEAKAFSCSFGGSGMPPLVCQTGVWHPSNPASDKQVKFLNLPSTGAGDIEFRYIDNPPPGPTPVLDQWQVDVDFNPNLMPSDGVSTFDYLIKIDKSGAVPYLPWFLDVSLSGGNVGDAKLTKEIWSTNPDGSKLSLLHTLISDPANNVFDLHYNLPISLDQLYILDTANPGTLVGGGNIDNYQNTFRQVPGPLPILGAAAAFGSSRRLRRRLKATRLA